MMATSEMPTVPITPGEPESTRRLQALQEAHRMGLISYITSRTDPDGSKVYPVLYAGDVYELRPDEVLHFLYAWAAAEGAHRADRLAYRDNIRYRAGD